MPNVISFKELSQLDISTHDFDVCSSKIPKVVSNGYNDFFEKEEFDEDVLRDSLLEGAKRRGDVIESGIVLHYRIKGGFRNLAFVYLRGGLIRPLRFADDKNLNAWFVALYANFAEAPLYLLEFSPRSFSQHTVGAFVEQGGEAGIPAIVRAKAPSSFDTEELKRGSEKKVAFLERFKALPSMRSSIDPGKTAGLFRQYLAARKVKPKSKATAAAIAALGKTVGIVLPKEFAALYSVCNGGSQVFPNADLLSVTAIAKEWRAWKKIFDEWTLEDLQGNSYGSKGRTLGIYANPRWVPFAKDGGGNCWAFDFMPGKKGKLGQIIEFGPDHDTIPCLAPDLNTFLKDQTKQLSR